MGRDPSQGCAVVRLMSPSLASALVISLSLDFIPLDLQNVLESRRLHERLEGAWNNGGAMMALRTNGGVAGVSADGYIIPD